MADITPSFIWHDLITTNVEGAKAFYAKVIGWNMQPHPGQDYTVLLAGTMGVGGIMAIPAAACERGAPACWQGYVYVDDVDAYAKRILGKGGFVHQEPSDIPQVGRFAVVADPQGAMFIIFKPMSTEQPAHAPEGTPGLVGWNELHAVDGLKAFDWYEQVFGWSIERDMDMGPMGTYRIFRTGAKVAGGMLTKRPEMPQPFWAFYFNVESISAAMERTKTAGGKVMNGPMEVPGPMWIANCMDPQGAWFSMVAPKP